MADYNPLGNARFPYNQDADRAEITHFDAQNTTFEYHVGKTYQELFILMELKRKYQMCMARCECCKIDIDMDIEGGHIYPDGTVICSDCEGKTLEEILKENA